MAPLPAGSTFPTCTSSINFGSILLRSTTALSTADKSSSAYASLSPPFLALVTGVLTALRCLFVRDVHDELISLLNNYDILW